MATNVGTIELIARIDTSQYKKGAKDIARTNKDIEGGANNSSGRVSASWATAAKVGAAAMVAAAAIMVKTWINSASEIQSLRASFESLTGDVDATNAVMTTLYDLSKRTAFENKDIQAAGRNYLAAGVAVEDLGKVLKATADIAGATGANLGQLTLPLTQTIARGKLQTQDFYQILNSGAGALRKPLTQLAGKKGFGSLAEAMEKGAITSQDLLDVLQNVTKEGGFAFEGAIKQSQTFNGRMSNLRESITNVGLSILGVDAVTGQVDPSGPFAKLSTAVSAATSFLTKYQGTVKQIYTSIITFLPAMGKVIADFAKTLNDIFGPSLNVIWGSLKTLADTMINNVLPSVMKLWEAINPGFTKALKVLGLLLGAILIAQIWIFVNGVNFTYDVISKVINIVSQAIKWFGNFGGAVINAAKTMSKAFVGIGESIVSPFKKAFNAIVELWNKSIGKIELNIPDWVPRIGGKSFGVPDIPTLASGGIITSPTFAMIGEGNEAEAVIPLSKLDKMLSANNSSTSNSNITINLQGVFATSPAEQRKVAEQIADRLKEIQAARGLSGGIA